MLCLALVLIQIEERRHTSIKRSNYGTKQAYSRMVQINVKCISGNEFCELRKEQEQKTHLGLNQMEVDLTYKLRSEEYMYVLPFRTAVLRIGLGNSGEILDRFGGSL